MYSRIKYYIDSTGGFRCTEVDLCSESYQKHHLRKYILVSVKSEVSR